MLLTLLLSAALAGPPRLMWVTLSAPDTIQLLTQRHDVWEVDGDRALVYLSSADIVALKQAGLRLEPAEERMPALVESPGLMDSEQKMARSRPDPAAARISGIPGYSCYFTVEELYDAAGQLAAAHPERAQWRSIGDSWQRTQDPESGYPLMVLTLGTEGAPDLVMVSGVHAREYAPVQAALRFADELLTGDGSDPEATWLLDHRRIHLILMANPDGRKVAEQQILWRKNRRETACETGESLGVDLNRNFPYRWGCCAGSSDDACSETFRGDAASSEPEIDAILGHIDSVFTTEWTGTSPAPADTPGLFLDLHSYSELILWPWGATSEPAPNAEALSRLGHRLAAFTGYTPQPMVDLYPTDGTSSDHVYGTTGVASYTVEIGTEFFQTCDTFDEALYPPLRRLLRYAAIVADAPYLAPVGPDVAASLTPGQRRRLELTLQADQPLAAAQYTIDVPPGMPGAEPVAMRRTADGKVAYAATIQRLPPGRHILFVRGRDEAGNWGPPAALFIETP